MTEIISEIQGLFFSFVSFFKISLAQKNHRKRVLEMYLSHLIIGPDLDLNWRSGKPLEKKCYT